jgi:hypothetical protein
MNFRLKPALAPVLVALALNVFAQEREARPQEDPAQQRTRALEERLNFMEQSLAKDIDDLMWFRRMDDVAVVDNAPGGHAFNRIDTRLAKESRLEIWRFLAQYLNPPNPVK